MLQNQTNASSSQWAATHQTHPQVYSYVVGSQDSTILKKRCVGGLHAERPLEALLRYCPLVAHPCPWRTYPSLAILENGGGLRSGMEEG
jgi:hypothetical protein